MTTASDDPLLLDRQICFPIYAASNLLNRMYRPVLDKLGLTYPQYLVMLVLWEDEPQSVGDLGARLYLDSGTLTPLLKRLESAGFVKRRRDKEDERRVLVGLTARGRALKTRAVSVPETLVSHMARVGGNQPAPDPAGAAAFRDAIRHFVAMLAAAEEHA